MLRGVELITSEELRLSLAEAEALAELLTVSPAIESVHDAWHASQGHAALFAVMTHASQGTQPTGGESRTFSRLVQHILAAHATVADQRVLSIAAMMKSGSSRELGRLGELDAVGSLTRLASVLPLLAVQIGGGGAIRDGVTFCVHDLLVDFVLGSLDFALPTEQIQILADSLVDRGDVKRAADVIAFAGGEAILGFLGGHGFACLQRGAAASLRNLLESVPLSEVMGRPRLLLLWSDVLLDCDDFEEALSKARAARVLAEHEGDATIVAQATANCLDALRLMNRWDEAAGLLDQVQQVSHQTGITPLARAALLRAAAPLHVLAGEYARGEELLRQGWEIGRRGEGRALADSREAGQTLALLPCFRYGDFVATGQFLSPYAAMDEGTLALRVDARGNLAAALLETGRINRSRGLLRRIVEIAQDSSLVYFLPVLGCVLMAEGHEREGIETIAEGIRKGIASGAEAEAAQNRVYEAMLLRAAGRFEDSLTSAERAYERLCVQDFMDFRRLAALEVAASLLAMGDSSASRAWAESAVESGFGENLHHAFRAAMILALCDFAEGDREGGVLRLSAHAEHLRSGNSNFQAAMYARAFPELVGLMVESFGAGSLPIHLCRMIPSKNAEQILRACRDQTASEEWDVLGRRLLGESQFDAFVERKGRPICRVRLFGGLSLDVGDRTVLDREWKKRKARLLFAMLVSRRGQEIAREQIFDLLWPDLPGDRAKNNFYVAWSAMKAALMGQTSAPGGCPYVDNAGGRCRIVPMTVRSDLDEFEEALQDAKQADASSDSGRAIEALERIAGVYHGDLLASDPYEDWIVVLRDRYRFEFVSAMLRLAELLMDRDDPCQALVHVRRAIQVDPQREDLYQMALRCHIAAGQRSAAVETFIACKSQLAEELGLDPSADTVALYQQILVMEDRPRVDDYGLG